MMKRYVALVIKFDPLTGERAGNIDVRRDRGLICPPLWQDLNKGIEMRLVVDDRDVSRYKGIEGIEVIEGKDAINTKARELFRPRHSVANPDLFKISVERMLREGRLREDELKPLKPEEQLKLCYEKGALGMRKQGPYQIP
jgi:hypothetical protein